MPVFTAECYCNMHFACPHAHGEYGARCECSCHGMPDERTIEKATVAVVQFGSALTSAIRAMKQWAGARRLMSR